MRKSVAHISANSRLDASRRGMSVLEFVGCSIAVIGGIWLGAVYLGVDVRHVAHTALSETELLDKMPPHLRPPGPQDGVTREQLVATLREELGALKTEISSLHGGQAGAGRGAASGSDATSSATTQSTRDHSYAYWERLNEIALGEAALQSDAESAFDAANAAKVFAIKGRVSRFAARAVEAVPSHQVDPALVQFGRQLSLWYDHGGELYERAVQIWESATTSQSRTQLNEEWKRAELHHKNEARLLRDKAAGVRSLISRHFGEEFPAFAQTTERAN